ncbi:MAG: hypothetical protein ABSH32_03270, partial [Bryobacteraceae bacterium]
KATAVGQFFLGNAEAGTERAHIAREHFANFNSGFSQRSLVLHVKIAAAKGVPHQRIEETMPTGLQNTSSMLRAGVLYNRFFGGSGYAT